jgi:hypothetical protein
MKQKNKKLSKLFKLLLGLIFFVAPFICQGKTWYVSPKGNNSGSGDINAPFESIAYAMDMMIPGDSCVLRKGVYRETVEVHKSGLSLCNYLNEKVEITGCKLVKTETGTFTNPNNNQSFSRVRFNEKVYQLFIDGKRMNIARCPNKTTPMLSMQDWETSTVDAAGKSKVVSMPTIPSQPENYWKGGYYIGVNDEKDRLATWFTGGGEISSSSGDVLHLVNTCYGVGTKHANGNGFGYILNCLNALDTEKEWYWGNGYLYFKAPEGMTNKEILVEARTKVYIMDIKSDDVNIKGIDFKAGAIQIEGNNAKIENCTFRYTSPFVWNAGDNGTESGARCNWGDYKNGSSGICVLGNGLSMKSCYVANSWFNGIVLWGNSCNIENCIIEDVNWMGKRCSGINSYGEDNTIRYCTIRNTGASSIEGGNGNWIEKYAIRNTWEHNLCENACKLVVDQGFFYVNHQSGSSPVANSEWCYNFLKNNRGPDRGEWTGTHVGLYVDNSSSGYKVHHNVVVYLKEGIRYNDRKEGKEAGKGVYFYNNTFYRTDRCMIYQYWNPSMPAQPDAEVLVENNLGIDCGGYGERNNKKQFGKSNVEYAEKSSVKEANNFDFVLKNEKYIDAGVLIEGIGIDFKGTAPDIGAYENGLMVWRAGSDLVVPDEFKDDELTKHCLVTPLNEIYFTLYPNPVSTILNIDFEDIDWGNKILINVIDPHGRILFSETNYEKNPRVDLSTLQLGIYFLKVDGKGFSGASMFCKLN